VECGAQKMCCNLLHIILKPNLLSCEIYRSMFVIVLPFESLTLLIITLYGCPTVKVAPMFSIVITLPRTVQEGWILAVTPAAQFVTAARPSLQLVFTNCGGGGGLHVT
jgi:hypothetical protein